MLRFVLCALSFRSRCHMATGIIPSSFVVRDVHWLPRGQHSWALTEITMAVTGSKDYWFALWHT